MPCVHACAGWSKNSVRQGTQGPDRSFGVWPWRKAKEGSLHCRYRHRTRRQGNGRHVADITTVPEGEGTTTGPGCAFEVTRNYYNTFSVTVNKQIHVPRFCNSNSLSRKLIHKGVHVASFFIRLLDQSHSSWQIAMGREIVISVCAHQRSSGWGVTGRDPVTDDTGTVPDITVDRL